MATGLRDLRDPEFYRDLLTALVNDVSLQDSELRRRSAAGEPLLSDQEAKEYITALGGGMVGGGIKSVLGKAGSGRFLGLIKRISSRSARTPVQQTLGLKSGSVTKLKALTRPGLTSPGTPLTPEAVITSSRWSRFKTAHPKLTGPTARAAGLLAGAAGVYNMVDPLTAFLSGGIRDQGQTPQAAANRAEVNRRSGLSQQQTATPYQPTGGIGTTPAVNATEVPRQPQDIAQMLQEAYQSRFGALPQEGNVGWGFRMGPAGYKPNYAGDYRAQVLGASTNDPRLNRQYNQQVVEEQMGMANAGGLTDTLGRLGMSNITRDQQNMLEGLMIRSAAEKARNPLINQIQKGKLDTLQARNALANYKARNESKQADITLEGLLASGMDPLQARREVRDQYAGL